MSQNDRLKLIKALEEYEPCDEKGKNDKARMIQFIAGNSFCFDSTHPPQKGEESEDQMGHITGSAWLLNTNMDSVLLTHHKKLNKWLQLGGHSDGHQNVLETALREAHEESGIKEIKVLSTEIFDIDIHEFPQKGSVAAHLHYDIRFVFRAKNNEFLVSEESHQLEWVGLSQIKNGNFEVSVQRMARKSPQNEKKVIRV